MLPTYAELLARTDGPPASSWGLFGERGTAELAGAEQVIAAAGTVRRGAVFNLDYPLDTFDPPFFARRTPPVQTIVSNHADHRDDRIDNFWPQVSSQLDGLRHFRHGEHGFYDGVPADKIQVGTPDLGINRWAEKPVVGRGLLVDVAAYREAAGRPIDHAAGERLPVSDVDGAMAAQNVAPRQGDILLLHTGWTHWYVSDPTEKSRQDVRAGIRSTGLAQRNETLEWLWDNHFSIAGSDTLALEALPAAADSPTAGNLAGGMLHPNILGLLGLPIGELWRLHELAEDCASDRVYECLVVIKPLNITGGVASPPNATAIK
ncbi:cyclase family protein [Fodinicola acaciae]|uniref:cyclase family protein n=1 Tax=Fodinicola acaciae TaxID=2681555 RepID=UPI0013CFC2A9|nr:cyclase family protein [Fodinicola acaciae]